MKRIVQLQLSLLITIATSAILFSCAGAKKVREYKQVVGENTQAHNQVVDSLKKADSLRSVKFNNGALDIVSSNKIASFIDSLIKLSMNHLKDDSIMNKTKTNHNNIEYILAKAYRLAQLAKGQLDNVKLINDLLAVNTFVQLDMSSFFETGQYKIEGPNKDKAIQSFSPIIKDLVAFSERFHDKKLFATIVIIGYADAQTINNESELAAILKDKLNKADATSAELNRELSRLRAGAAAVVIQQIINDERNVSEKFRNLSIELLPQGRGEDYPDPKIKNYKADDERRRVVNVYWSLLPIYQPKE